MEKHAHDARQLKFELNPKDLKPLFKTKPFLHAGAIIFNWAVIFGAIFLFIQSSSIWVYILAVIVIGTRMHALAILMHDAAHFRFLKK